MAEAVMLHVVAFTTFYMAVVFNVIHVNLNDANIMNYPCMLY